MPISEIPQNVLFIQENNMASFMNGEVAPFFLRIKID
jgi:hypothetical protein